MNPAWGSRRRSYDDPTLAPRPRRPRVQRPRHAPPRPSDAAGPASPASTRAFVLPERDLLPESMAFDPKTGSFFVGSMHRRKIVHRDRDGRVRDWAGPERGLWSILGIKIDASRGELWANSCNMGDELPMTPADPATVGRGALLRLRLTDGSLVRRYEPSAAARPICFNDLALSPAGDVYLTAGPGGLWRLPRGSDTLEPLIRDTTLWLNGIATGSGGALYAADDSMGPLLVEPASGRWAARRRSRGGHASRHRRALRPSRRAGLDPERRRAGPGGAGSARRGWSDAGGPAGARRRASGLRGLPPPSSAPFAAAAGSRRSTPCATT